MTDVPGPFSEDLEPLISGPPRYTSRTEKPVEHITLTDARDVVIGYFYANDDDDAAGWQGRRAAGPASWNLAGPWIRRLRDAKKRGLKPSAALDELIRAGTDDPANPRSRVIAGSRRTAASLTELKRLADAPGGAD
jgi:hypothetical protein